MPKSSPWGIVIVGALIALVVWWQYPNIGQVPQQQKVSSPPVSYVCGVVNPRPSNVIYHVPADRWGEPVEIPKSGEAGCVVRIALSIDVHGRVKMQCKSFYYSAWFDVDPYGKETNCATFRYRGTNGAVDVPFSFVSDRG